MDEVRRIEVANVGRRDVEPVRKWYRIYPNPVDDPDKLCVVDEGVPGTEHYCFKVICSSDRPAATDHYTDLRGQTGEPNWWVLAYGVLRECLDSKHRIVVTITKN
jgi:hypothetical protein